MYIPPSSIKPANFMLPQNSNKRSDNLLGSPTTAEIYTALFPLSSFSFSLFDFHYIFTLWICLHLSTRQESIYLALVYLIIRLQSSSTYFCL